MLVEISIITASGVILLSPLMMRYGALRPANGEEKSLRQIRGEIIALKARFGCLGDKKERQSVGKNV